MKLLNYRHRLRYFLKYNKLTQILRHMQGWLQVPLMVFNVPPNAYQICHPTTNWIIMILLMWNSTVTIERENVLRVGKWNHGPFSLQAKPLHSTTSISWLFTSKCIVNHNWPSNSDYNVMLSRLVKFYPVECLSGQNIMQLLV